MMNFLHSCFPVRHLCARRHPRDVVARIDAEANRALQVPEVKDKPATLAIESGGTTPEELTTRLNDEIERIRLLVMLGALRPE